jgi:hypothetical protein
LVNFIKHPPVNNLFFTRGGEKNGDYGEKPGNIGDCRRKSKEIANIPNSPLFLSEAMI